MVEGVRQSPTPISNTQLPPDTGNKSDNKTHDAGDHALQAAQDSQQQAAQRAQEAQQEQAKQAVKEGLSEASESQAAQRLDLLQQFQKTKEKLQGQLNDFIQVVETVVQEGLEGYQAPMIDRGAGAFTQDHGQSFTPKEQQVIREFIREMQHLVGEQGLEFSNAFTFLKTQQGGDFWKALNQVLQKGMSGPGTQGMTPEQLAAKLKAAGALGVSEGIGDKEVLKGELGRGPGAALAEIIRAETNPKIHTEAMLAALALLKQEGMEKAHRELVQYLRHRWKMSEREMERFLRQYPVTYFQGPMKQEKFKSINTPWYPLIALVAIPIAVLFGMDWSLALFGGGLLTVVLFLVAYLSRNTD